jgi:DNA-binding LacI/PurR family transcriptional regulator
VPDDVAVVGFDDIDGAADGPVPLTTVRQPMVGIGRELVRLLWAAREASAESPGPVVLPTGWVERASA